MGHRGLTTGDAGVRASSRRRPCIVGIVNITVDSFSDGGRYLEPAAAVAHAYDLVADGADVVELGPASSHPEATRVDGAEEIRRVCDPLAELTASGLAISVDSCNAATVRHAIAGGAAFLNDVTGFADESLYEELAAAHCKLVVMHSVQRLPRADRRRVDAATVLDSIRRFFDARIAELERAGVARERVIVDPGMGLFLGADPAASYAVLAEVDTLRTRTGLPVMISVSRKSFLGAVTGRGVSARGPASLAAELHAARAGADYIRTHDVRALADALAVESAIVAARAG